MENIILEALKKGIELFYFNVKSEYFAEEFAEENYFDINLVNKVIKENF